MQAQSDQKLTPYPHSDRVLVNIGCGRTFHRTWVNLDLHPHDAAVRQFDILAGLPFAENSVDAVYHSHLLEHLTQEQGEKLLAECRRVLRPGGVLRIVVPDLEQIARLYLLNHDQAWNGDTAAAGRYEWMKLELLDQMVRCQSGGRMGRYMAELREEDADFVQSRVGNEYRICRSPDNRQDLMSATKKARGAGQPRAAGWRERVALWTVGKLLGQSTKSALRESLFRTRGEVHRWMYDRFSLKSLCLLTGFTNFTLCTATISQISGFNAFELDAQGGQVRKPDSIFVECTKPAVAYAAANVSKAA